MTTTKEPNYCHDPEIIAAAERLGIRDKNLINRILSHTEGPYRTTDDAIALLIDFKERIRANKRDQPKLRLSDRRKREILEKHGQ